MEYSVLVPCPLTLLLHLCVVVTAIVGMYASVTFLNYVKSIYTIFMYIQSLCVRMLFSSCSSSCKCGIECNNKPFQHRYVKKLKLIQVIVQIVSLGFLRLCCCCWFVNIICFLQTDKCGSGIVAEEEIQQGEFIIEYVGEGNDVMTSLMFFASLMNLLEPVLLILSFVSSNLLA